MIRCNILIIGKGVGMDLVILYIQLNIFLNVDAVAKNTLLAFEELNSDQSFILVSCKEIKIKK